jgi:hypothetical protein
MLHWVSGILMLLLVAACGGGADLDEPPVALGDFNLVHNIVVAPKAQRGPLSRKATEDQLVAAMRGAIAERFDRYEGDVDYHFGISVEGYVLAAPGVPIVLAPKSILIINLTVWDDAAGKKLNDEPHQITVLETFGTGAVIGSGYTLDAEAQLAQLSQNAAKAVERYLVKQQAEQGWFKADVVAPAALDAAETSPVPAE